MEGVQTANETTTRPRAGTVEQLGMKLEIVVVPVADVDRAKRFYEGIGWRLDADFTFSPEFRLVQLTPPRSGCSVFIGQGVTTAAPGSARGLYLVVDDLEATRAALKKRGVDVSETFHDGFQADPSRRQRGPDPEGRSYLSLASFNDPDGNEWLLQEVRERLPGRVSAVDVAPDVASLTTLLREAEEHHGAYEATAPKHHWSGWYAAYIVARGEGSTPDEASAAAARHMGIRH